MENNLYSLRGGFKKARSRKGIKQKEVAKQMGVTLKTVMNWEQGISNPDLETTMRLAELFDCDLDYLTGRIEESTHDIHFVHEYTGLSEKAIKWISCQTAWINSSPPEPSATVKCLNHMIEADGFRDFMDSYMNFQFVADRLKKSAVSGRTANLVYQDTVELSIDAAARFFMQDVAQAVLRLCEEDYKKSYEAYRKNIESHNDRRKD